MVPPDPVSHFSTVARAYAAYRPSYPPSLFDWLASVASKDYQKWIDLQYA